MQKGFRIIYSHEDTPKKSNNDWSYHHIEEWLEKFPLANGANQSPIDLNKNNSQFDEILAKLEINYESSTFSEIINTGKSFQIKADNQNSSKIFQNTENIIF